MPVTLAGNQVPSGTLPGSPIEVVDVHNDAGQGRENVSIPVPAKAQADDYMVAFFGMGYQSSFTYTAPSFTGFSATGVFGSGDGLTDTWIANRVVAKNDAGTAFVWNFTESSFTTWSLVVYTLRYVNLTTPVNVYGAGALGNNVINTGTGPCTPSIPNTLILGYIEAAANAFVAGSGIGPGPLPAWLTEAIASNAQPTAGMVSGVLDMPASGVWQGAGCQWAQGSTNVSVSYAGWSLALAPQPAPGAPSLTVTSGGATVPSGGHADAAAQSGAPFAVHIGYTPVSGQGTQEAFLIGREWNSDGSHTAYWNADDNVWSTTEYWNYQTTSDYTFPGNAVGFWDDGVTWKLKVAVKEKKLHYSSAPSAAFVFTAQAPAIVLTPTVTGTATPTPTVNWTETLDSGATQASWRVRIFTLAQTTAAGFNANTTTPLQDSGYTLGTALTWTVPASMAPGSFKAYVQVSDSRGMVSNWTASATFTVSYSQPASGSLVAVLTP